MNNIKLGDLLRVLEEESKLVIINGLDYKHCDREEALQECNLELIVEEVRYSMPYNSIWIECYREG